MDITDAFMQDAVADAGISLSEEEMTNLNDWIEELYRDQYRSLESSEDYDDAKAHPEDTVELWKMLATASFVAGRVYQTQFDPEAGSFEMLVSPNVAKALIEFMSDRLAQLSE